MTNLNIYYLPEFIYERDCATRNLLANEFPEHNITTLAYDGTKSFVDNMDELKNGLAYEEDTIIIGFGLGGYYAAWLSDYLSIPGLLLNPWTFPKEIFNGFYAQNELIGNNPANSYKPLDNLRGRVARIVVIGNNDWVTPPEKSIYFWRERSQVITTEDWHCIRTLLFCKSEIEHLPYIIFL